MLQFGHIPPLAQYIDTPLINVGAGVDHQLVVYGRVCSVKSEAIIVAVLVKEHPCAEGCVGRFYGTRLRGIVIDDLFRPWWTDPLGEVRWDPKRGWVQVSGEAV